MEYTVLIPGTPLTVRISKIGGGTVGEQYTGTWSYMITGPGVWIEGEDLNTGMPHSHAYAAALAPTYFFDELDEPWGGPITLFYNDVCGGNDDDNEDNWIWVEELEG